MIDAKVVQSALQTVKTSLVSLLVKPAMSFVQVIHEVQSMAMKHGSAKALSGVVAQNGSELERQSTAPTLALRIA